jgi:hypothetical protein
LLTLAFLTSAAAQPPQPEILEPAPAYQDAHGTAASALITRIAMLARAGDGDGLVALAHEVLDDVALAPAARARVLYETAMALAEIGTSADTQALLELLGRHDVEVQVWRYDDAHRTAVPLYEVAAAARYAERRRNERASSASALEAIARGSDAPLQTFEASATANDAPARAGILHAFETAPPQALLAYRDRLSLAVERGADLEIAEIVALRLADAMLMQSALEHADARLALEIVRTTRASFTEPAALELLKRASARADVGSAALLAAGPMAMDDPDARAWLFDMLRDERRAGSAAAALAALHDPAVAASLRTWSLEQKTPSLARRGVLALRLDGSDSARAELAKIAADPALDPALRAEALR